MTSRLPFFSKFFFLLVVVVVFVVDVVVVVEDDVVVVVPVVAAEAGASYCLFELTPDFSSFLVGAAMVRCQDSTTLESIEFMIAI